MNHPYNVVEDGQITIQSVHLIENEIPESLRYIEQSGNQWHKATALHKQKVNTFITMKMVNNTTLAATTTPLTLRYLALIHTANLYKNMSENESKTTLLALKKTFENLSEDTQKTTYETLYNNVLNSHRSSFELIGQLNWTNTEPIFKHSANDVLIL
jgi:lysine/ornithine N-monooxygenase